MLIAALFHSIDRMPFLVEIQVHLFLIHRISVIPLAIPLSSASALDKDPTICICVCNEV